MTCACLKPCGLSGICDDCMLRMQGGHLTVPRTQAEFDRLGDVEKARLDRLHNVITSAKELSGWEIMGLVAFKPGVVKWFAERNSPIGLGRERREGYAKLQVFAHLQILPPR